ncbi:FAD/NAD(P)-binding domain-containing protein [Athelia psychrophila]|uniref:FAD/NAD(P)-binding domain-containing protein n=1 Tax=Athelia psychrophila TaxID=1759441 RepID=A0A167VBD8_9AGAM|nr:FAD/NAD(P)-binding domain-containing protein [Fibularhizoctonia sp. CBS 109695]
MSNIRVAVIGGGIGGLTFCVALGKQSNIKVDMYEAAREFGEVGAGIAMWYRTQQIMEKLGLHNDLEALAGGAKKGAAELAFHFRKSDQPEGLSFYDMNTRGGMWAFHRAKFQKTIINHLPPTCTSHFGKRLVAYDAPVSGPITLHFKDGTAAECDVLVGADGIKSTVRAIMYSNLVKEGKITKEEVLEPNPVWSGTVAYRGLISKERLEAKILGHRALTRAVLHMGKNKHLIIFPINDALINVVAFCSDFSKEGTQYSEDSGDWVVDVPKEELLQQYEGWEPEVMAVLECIEKPSKWAINVVRPPSTYVSGHVAILGDSAHAMTPHLGSGAGQAIEDAYILAALLANPKCTLASLPRVLQIYDEVRRPKANNVWNLSRKNGSMYEFAGPVCGEFRLHDDNFNSESLAKIAKVVMENYEWAWNTSAEEDRNQAVSMLSKL